MARALLQPMAGLLLKSAVGVVETRVNRPSVRIDLPANDSDHLPMVLVSLLQSRAVEHPHRYARNCRAAVIGRIGTIQFRRERAPELVGHRQRVASDSVG